jgi:hypothetical protein
MLSIKSRLTVFDNLPLEVIRTFILPHLNYEERIHLNRCLPVQDRFSRKMDPKSILKHDYMIAISSMDIRLRACRDVSDSKKYKNIIAMFKNLQGVRCFRMIAENPEFREITITKMNEMMHDLIRVEIQIDLNQRLKLASEIKKLRKKIQLNSPYGPEIRYDTIPSLTFQ